MQTPDIHHADVSSLWCCLVPEKNPPHNKLDNGTGAVWYLMLERDCIDVFLKTTGSWLRWQRVYHSGAFNGCEVDCTNWKVMFPSAVWCCCSSCTPNSEFILIPTIFTYIDQSFTYIDVFNGCQSFLVQRKKNPDVGTGSLLGVGNHLADHDVGSCFW